MEHFINHLSDPQRKKDCQVLIEKMTQISNQPPVMWGASIIGFGKYHYKYESGREGDYFRIGFSPRKQYLTVYIMDGFNHYEQLLSKLGPYQNSTSCLYLKNLESINLDILEKLLAKSWESMFRKYPT